MKVIGRAVALARGYYPVSETGNCKIIEEAEEFDLREGHTKGKWFKRLDDDKPSRGRKSEAPPPAASDIA